MYPDTGFMDIFDVNPDAAHEILHALFVLECSDTVLYLIPETPDEGNGGLVVSGDFSTVWTVFRE